MFVPGRRGVIRLTLTAALCAIAIPSHADINGFSNFTLSGTNPTVSGNTLQITSNDRYFAANSAFNNDQQSIGAFNAHFTYQLGPLGSNATDGFSPADGFAFVLQNSTNGVSAVGDSGGAHGADIDHSAVLDFNIFSPRGVGTTVYSNGNSSGSFDPTGDVNLASGDVIDVSLAYQHDLLTAVLTDTATNEVFTTNYAVDIASSVGGPNAYVGFTGGTGGGTSDQFIRDFTFTPQAVPEASTVVTLALLSMGGLIVLRRRRTTAA